MPVPPAFVTIATPHAGDVSPLWLDSFIGLEKPFSEDSANGWTRLSTQRHEVAVARNLLAQSFLDQPRERATHLLFWDDDVLAPADGLMRLLALDAPIASGFYVSRHAPAEPVAYRRILPSRRKHLYQPVIPQTPGVFLADGVGAGFLLIRRDVLETLPRPFFQFVCGKPRGENLSEDLYFCEKALSAGYRILVDARVSCGHVGRYVFDDGDLDLSATMQAYPAQSAQAQSTPA